MMTGCCTPHSLRDHCQQCGPLIPALSGLAAAFCSSIKMRAVLLLALLALAAARVEPEGVLYPFDREPARAPKRRSPNVIQVRRRRRRRLQIAAAELARLPALAQSHQLLTCSTCFYCCRS